ncbi:MAG: diphosphomevalonate decarboxylase [Candidatus Pacebacteria bacterium]|nr:diphosphomevalonate decarboxylase [Candidatus Paceibacterota bacterium]
MSKLKASAIAPSNIAFSKYWGKIDDELTLPLNDSISMTLDTIFTHTTVEFGPQYAKNEVWLSDSKTKATLAKDQKQARVLQQLKRLRRLAGVKDFAKVVSHNNFPTGAGIASSASGFSALTAACLAALNIQVDKKQQSILTRLAGSGSATRSVYGGFVKWHQGKNSESSYAEQLYDQDHWDLANIILVTESAAKKHSSLIGHARSKSSPFMVARLKAVLQHNQDLETALKSKDFQLLGQVIEQEMFSLHAVTMTSQPPILYWNGTTVEILHEVRKLRDQGLESYATLDAGPNVHLITESSNIKKLQKHFSDFVGVKQIFVCKVGKGVKITKQHLF